MDSKRASNAARHAAADRWWRHFTHLDAFRALSPCVYLAPCTPAATCALQLAAALARDDPAIASAKAALLAAGYNITEIPDLFGDLFEICANIVLNSPTLSAIADSIDFHRVAEAAVRLVYTEDGPYINNETGVRRH